MTNYIPIKELKKAVICFKEKANEIIKRLNIPWKVKMPEDNNKWGVPEVSYSEKEIVIDLTKLSYFKGTVCVTNADGSQVQKTAFILGYIVDETDDD